ncbi:co-chaperone HscB [Catenovulum adriaticum]|uniref:Co-chaperone protein HscB homolog n=1 Tax=Catenovulum adriaticum TaxID=2984846 RepID=A0ABY7AHU1_9ALTE|nr:co-chaperone HscB [Catenovulum sp. TS8]WAJ69024.1 co-chaperone HscB [Catenovulum sp. TS8]
MNFFELFNLEAGYDLDVKLLAERYRQLQRAFHPDKYASGSESERLLAVKKSAQINDAFSTLKSPVARAEYLLNLVGIDLAHETKTLQDPEFLMQQMEYREHLEDVQAMSDPFPAIVDFEKTLAQEQATLQQSISQQLADAAYDDAANSVRKLKFIIKLNHELERLEDQVTN